MKMDYCVFGTNNMEASINFYDSLFQQTELKKVLTTERMTFWQCEDFAFAIATPFNEEAASNGNGTMIGLNVGSKEEVKRLHQKVLDLGGTCEGEPGQRGPKFSAYARDLDKNKIVFSA
jgi:predicted lactoylglutathione lyase